MEASNSTDDDDDYNTDDGNFQLRSGNKIKRKRGINHFNGNWSKLYPWIIAGEENFAKCLYCCSEFSVERAGISSIKKHMKTEKHERNMKRASSNRSLNSFLKSSSSTFSNNKTAAAEATFHNISLIV